jgi:hypothetical protein
MMSTIDVSGMAAADKVGEALKRSLDRSETAAENRGAPGTLCQLIV